MPCPAGLKGLLRGEVEEKVETGDERTGEEDQLRPRVSHSVYVQGGPKNGATDSPP